MLFSSTKRLNICKKATDFSLLLEGQNIGKNISKNLSNKYSIETYRQKPLDRAEQSITDALKTTSKKSI